MGAGETDCATYDTIHAKMDNYFAVQHNVIYELVISINRWVQELGETAEVFIVAVYSLAAECNFTEMKNNLIKDSLVTGIWESSLLEHFHS